LDEHSRRIENNRVCHRSLFPNRPISHKTIATTEGRTQGCPIGSERFANCGDVNLKRIFLDDRARPYTRHEFVPGDELASGLHQSRKDLKCTAAQRNGGSTHPQFTAREIQLPPARLVHQVSILFRHAWRTF
jgi:hypothetical protein